MAEKTKQDKETLFLNVLNSIAKLGLNEKSILEGFAISGRKKEWFWALYPLGIKQLILELENWMDECAFENFEPDEKINKTVKKALEARLNLVVKYKESYIHIQNFLKKPMNLRTLIKARTNTADAIWNLCEIDETGFAYYSRRAILINIYSKAISNVINSKDWEKIMNQDLAKVGKIAKMKNRILSFLGFKK